MTATMPALVSDRSTTALAKVLVTALVVVATALGVGLLTSGGTVRLATVLVLLYVAAVVVLGVWQTQLAGRRFTRALSFGFLALVVSLWDATAVLTPVLLLPGIAIVLWPVIERGA